MCIIFCNSAKLLVTRAVMSMNMADVPRKDQRTYPIAILIQYNLEPQLRFEMRRVSLEEFGPCAKD